MNSKKSPSQLREILASAARVGLRQHYKEKWVMFAGLALPEVYAKSVEVGETDQKAIAKQCFTIADEMVSAMNQLLNEPAVLLYRKFLDAQRFEQNERRSS